MKNHENEEKLYRGAIGQLMIMKEEEYLGIDDPVYVAQIQRTIAAKSDCLVLVGGVSMFQKAAITFHKSLHPNPKEQCIIFHCYFPVNFDTHRFKVK